MAAKKKNRWSKPAATGGLTPHLCLNLDKFIRMDWAAIGIAFALQRLFCQCMDRSKT